MDGSLAQAAAREGLDALAHAVGMALEAAGIVVIVVGGLGATIVFARSALQRASFHASFEAYRRHLGRAILLGLEFLVAADIVGTVLVDPTFSNLGVLAVLVLIRTFLSFALTLEVEGRWPWQSARRQEAAE